MSLFMEIANSILKNKLPDIIKMSPTLNYTTSVGAHGNTVKHVLEWSIPDFLDTMRKSATKELCSEEGDVVGVDPPERMFRLKVKGLGSELNFFEFYYLTLSSVFVLKMNWEIKETFKFSSIKHNEYFDVNSYKWLYGCQFYNSGNNITHLKYGELHLKVTFIIKNPNLYELAPNEAAIKTKLDDDLEVLLKDGVFSDMVIKSIEGDEFKVHKVILASRSDVLKAHFKHNTTECLTNIVESPFETQVLREVLTYIYSDKAPNLEEMPGKLLDAADFYQLIGLKNLCEEALRSKLNVNNAIETLKLAQLHSANTLERTTIDFIRENAKLVTQSESWAKIQSIEFLKKIFQYIFT